MNKKVIVTKENGAKGRRRRWLPFLLGMQLMLCIGFIFGILSLTHAADFQFVVMADSRGPGTSTPINTGSFTATLASAINKAPNPAFLLFGGDLVYGGVPGPDLETHFENWLNIVDNYYPRSIIYPAFGGNHEQNFLDENYPHVWSAFSEKFNPAGAVFFNEASYGKTVYYFDYLDARFFVLNNELVRSEGIVNEELHYAFDEGSETTATDLVDANHGTISGATPVVGKHGKALSFDGNDYVTRANPSSALKPSQLVAISAWINPTALDSSGSEVVSMGDSYALRVTTDGNIRFFYYNGSRWSNFTTTGVDVRVGDWHHIVGQKTSSALEVYVDGVLKGRVNNTGTIMYTLGARLFHREAWTRQ